MPTTKSAEYYLSKANYYLAQSANELRAANDLEAAERDGDAYLVRENAYWHGCDATYFFRRAYQVRDKVVTSQLDTSEQTD